ncbi:MAG: organic solvent tolerance protein OstA [Pirellulaceae bacterium]
MNRNPMQFEHAGLRANPLTVCACRIVVFCLAWLGFVGTAAAQIDIEFPLPTPELGIQANARQISRWTQGSWDVFHLAGQARINQGHVTLSAGEAILWIDREPGEQPRTVILWLEQSVQVDVANPARPGDGTAATRMVDQQWFGRLFTLSEVQFQNFVQEISPDNAPPIFARGMTRRQQETTRVQPAQYLAPGNPTVISPITGEVQQVPLNTPAQGAGGYMQAPLPVNPQPAIVGGDMTTSVQIIQRSSANSNVRGFQGQRPGEFVQILTGGVRVNVNSDELAEVDQFGQPRTGRVVIQADNVVAWRNPVLNPDGTGGARYEIYLEGNVIFAQGNRVVYADRMYYDTTFKRGTILNADVLTPIPSYAGLMRLKADVVQQLNENQYQAFGAAITSSRLGVPRYWLQSDQITVTRQQQPAFDPITGYTFVDPATGLPTAGENYFAESNANRVYLLGVPIFYWPTLRNDLRNPNFYIERVRVGNDNVFGFQAGVGFDLLQMLGIRNVPQNTRWVGNLDYLSERGLGFGTDVDYQTQSFFGIPGRTDGYLRSWFINDSGLDNLGRDRRVVPLEETFRGRVLARHRQVFAPGFQLRGEVGWISDRNFLEQYYEREWDEDKDYNTGLWLERNLGTQSFNLLADYRLNDFVTQTDWLPRADHFILGQPLLGERLVWHGHSTIGYGRFRSAVPPTNAVDFAKWDPLAWEQPGAAITGVDREGIVAGARHELDFPVQLGAVRVVPYVLGDASYWQEDLVGAEVTRLLGQTGLRASLPMWRVDPTIHSTLLNLNGLAHKVTWDAEFLYANSDQDFERLPLYNPLDDDAQEFFRRRFAFDTFGIAQGVGANTPLRFDERFYALRSGLQGSVATPNMEIADDLMIVKAGLRNRWQTKRGLPGEARVVDWITLDIQGNFYPDAARDNFGSDFGMLDYDFRWHVGDRLSLVSDGYFDFFADGLRTASVGTHMSRPGIGNLYVGFRTIEGPISSNTLNAALTYRMSDKWIVRGTSSYDFGPTGNIGQSLNFIRIGESFLISAGVNADISRDNVGFIFSIEPRFLPTGQLGLVGGQRIPPASANYLE